MRTNWFFPPPLTSTSTISMPSESATRCAISSMRDDVACRIMNRTGCPPNKKVGFRPLDRFDTPRTIVQRMGRNASWVESTPRPPTGRAMWRMIGVLAELGRPLEGGPLGALPGDAALAAILPAAAPSGQSGDTENRFKNRVGRHSRYWGEIFNCHLVHSANAPDDKAWIVHSHSFIMNGKRRQHVADLLNRGPLGRFTGR